MTYYFNTAKTTDLNEECENRVSRKRTDRWIFALLLLAMALIPLLVGGHVKNVVGPHISTIGLLTSGVKGDLFTYYKMVSLIILTVIAVIMLLSKLFFMNGKLRSTKLNLFISIFAVAIILSTIFSKSISIALWGQFNRSDGAISYICYLTLFFVAMNIEYPKRAIHYVMYALYPFVFINLFLITMNFYGHDAMKYPLVQKMMTMFVPEGASLGDNSILLGTLNQWNYMSGMFAVMTVMYLAWAIIDLNKIRSIINTVFAVVSFAIMLMSTSTSGFLTIVVLIPLLIVLVYKSGNYKKALVAVLAFAFLSAPIFHILAEKSPRVWSESIGFLIEKNPYVKEQPNAMNASEFKYTLENKAFAAENQFELPELPERGIAAGSGRAYIWEKTYDLTIDRPLFGYGLDTLMYHFPHYNIDARAGMWDENTIIDKPHSMYMGIFYGTGIVGIIGFAGIAILTVSAALKIVFTRRQATIAVLAVGWIAYLFQALFNDSLPGSTGPMWTIAGMMIGILMLNNDIEEKTNGRND
ncbi:O-antigen ligase family protein [Sporosarcina luteola]|uniref:O-antigen ligase family protein n=1 Tax=Sporosarcina luteola TaxID=582850 RepID=UPI00203A4DB3|nr:O-antigen ligase family protein [Sporosarcina luteola]MCM3636536.1 O-antigen ligase family protein [Sporosarcina luteola]